MDSGQPSDSEPTVAPYGNWQSPIDAEALASDAVPLERPLFAGEDVYWSERRPRDGGRSVIVRRSPDGQSIDVTPADPFNARTRVHEYGGGAYTVADSTVYFCNYDDQRLYRQDGEDLPSPLTPVPDVSSGARYADFEVTGDRRLLICVQEIHSADGQVVNELAVVPTDGSLVVRTIVSGFDFFAAPRISGDGRRLAWICWNHPQMPWDGTELWIGDLDDAATVTNPRRVAGGSEESIFQPSWGPAGDLHFVSDRTGWWNLYRFDGDAIAPTPDDAVAVAPDNAEYGVPHWNFGSSTYGFLADGRIAAIRSSGGIDRLVLVSSDGHVEPVDLPYTSYAPSLVTAGRMIAFIAGSSGEAAALVRLDVESQTLETLRSSSTQTLEEAYVSRPESIEYVTGDGGQRAFALFYAPTNPRFTGPDGERPPLIVVIHGGPTSMAAAQLSMSTQYWTTRGFAVVDVNYGGSSGFGRAYRNRLKKAWGVLDTDDCISAARHLVAKGCVDPRKLAIRGASAGGYTTLCALTFHDVFASGASYYGIGDCEILAGDTHKFEKHYMDGLIGKYPEEKEIYYARSPVHFVERMSCPVILFQGSTDKVVPPTQAQAMVATLDAEHLPYAYLLFKGEGHGFLKAENIKRSLEAELYFYSKTLRFPLRDDIKPVTIHNFDQ